MPKIVYLFLFAFVPTIIGYLHNMVTGWMISIHVSFIFPIYWYGTAFLMTCFWFWVGGKFAKSNANIAVIMCLQCSITDTPFEEMEIVKTDNVSISEIDSSTFLSLRGE